MPKREVPENLGKQWELFFAEERDFQKQPPPKKISTFVRSVLKNGLIGASRDILECGCGSGEVSIELALKGFNVTALDYSRIMCGEIGRLVNLFRKERNKLKLHIVRADMAALPFEDRSYDLTFSIGAFEHWLEEDKRYHIIQEMARVTRSRGKIILVVPNGKHVLYRLWRFIIKQKTPKEVRYSAQSLADEISRFGFQEVKVLPMGVNRGFSKYLRFRWLELPVLWGSAIIDLLPMILRRRLTVHFMCVAEVR